MRRDHNSQKLFIDVSCDVGNEDMIDTPVFANSTKTTQALQKGSHGLFKETERPLLTSKPKQSMHYFVEARRQLSRNNNLQSNDSRKSFIA